MMVGESLIIYYSNLLTESDDSDEEEKDDDQKLPNGLSPPTHGNQSHFTLDLNISKGVLDVCPVFKVLCYLSAREYH